jgi:Zn-dependent protease with chaperone function
MLARLPRVWPIFCLFTFAILPVGCATVPITGRSQLSLISDDAAIRMADERFSAFMAGEHRKGTVLQATESPEAARVLETIERVSNRIIDASGMRGARQWDFVVVKDRRRNAFVEFNGKVVVYTGLLPVAHDDAGLAAILGHEVGHVAGRHGIERASQALLIQLGILTAQVVVAAKDPRLARPVGDLGGLAALFGIQLPFSRAHESEADRLGLVYMARAGYDPAAALGVWERMEQASGSGPPEFFSTHPSHATRRADIQAWLPEAKRYYAERSRERPVAVAAMPNRPASPLASPAPEPVMPEGEPAATQEAHAPPPAGTSLEGQLQSLDALLSRRTITEIEYGLLRKRLIETWSFKEESAGPASRPARARASDRPWILGRWEGSHQGAQVSMDGTSLLFTLERGEVHWLMRRRTTIRNWTGNLQASGAVIAVTDSTVELRGHYDGFSEGRTSGKPLEYSLKRDGDQMEGVALGAEGIPFSLSLRRR